MGRRIRYNSVRLVQRVETFFREHGSPATTQDVLDTLPYNACEKGYACVSPATLTERILAGEGRAHCFEGALWAYAALWLAGMKPFLLNFRVVDDLDHVIVAYRKRGLWGSVSQSNTGVYRDRDPVHRDLRELVMTYFNLYVNLQGVKSLRAYSAPFAAASRLGTDWIGTREDVGWIGDQLDALPHTSLLPAGIESSLRRASDRLLAAVYSGTDPRGLVGRGDAPSLTEI